MIERARRVAKRNRGRNARTVDEWVVVITATWQKAVESIIETARHLAEAKEGLAYGEWGRMVERLPFGRSTADKLVAIAEDATLTNSEFIPKLPASWGTLYELTKLPEDEVSRLIASERINPDMTHADAAEILKEVREEGVYIYERVPEALGVVAKFMRRWPDPSEFAGLVWNDMQEGDHAMGPDELDAVLRWLTAVHAALSAEDARVEQGEETSALSRRRGGQKKPTPMLDRVRPGAAKSRGERFAGDPEHVIADPLADALHPVVEEKPRSRRRPPRS